MLSRLRTLSFYRQHWPIATALALLLICLLLPKFQLTKNTFHYVVTFDISQSMNVEDVMLNGEPVSRLRLARAGAAEALKQLPCGSKIGWSIFTEHRSFVLLMPLEVCKNFEALLSTLERIDDRLRWRDSSDIGKGVYWAVRNSDLTRGAHVVFMTDGHEAPPNRVGEQLTPHLEPNQAKGWLVGLGANQASRIPKTDSQGRISGYWTADEVIQKPGVPDGASHEHLSRLHEPHLKALAKHTGLRYFRMTETKSLVDAIKDKSLADKQPAPTDLRWIPGSLALLLLSTVHLPRPRVRRNSKPNRLNSESVKH